MAALFLDYCATKPATSEIAEYKDAILFGYEEMDDLPSAEFFKLAKGGTRFMLASVLGQKALFKRDRSGGQHFYRFRNLVIPTSREI